MKSGELRIVGLLMLLATTVPLSAEAEDAPAQKRSPLLESTDGFDVAYGASFSAYDRCGDFPIGKVVRAAIAAKAESCLTPAGREKFYKKAMQTANDALSESMAYLSTHSFSEYMANRERYCFHEKPADKEAYDLLKEKIAQYQAGTIGLPDILVVLKPGGTLRLGDTPTCEQFSKGGLPKIESSDAPGPDKAH